MNFEKCRGTILNFPCLSFSKCKSYIDSSLKTREDKTGMNILGYFKRNNSSSNAFDSFRDGKNSLLINLIEEVRFTIIKTTGIKLRHITLS